jgi:hypothetical protein
MCTYFYRSSVGVATYYFIVDRNPFPSIDGRSFLQYSMQTEMYCTYSVIGGSSPGVKQPGREANHSPSSSTHVKKNGDALHSIISFYGTVLNY